MPDSIPRFMTIRQTAAAGPLSEHHLRRLEKQGKLPCIYSGRKCLVNYDLLIDQLSNLGGRAIGN